MEKARGLSYDDLHLLVGQMATAKAKAAAKPKPKAKAQGKAKAKGAPDGAGPLQTVDFISLVGVLN